MFETLVGLEIRPRLVREAQNFWRTYEEKHGYEARDELLGSAGDSADRR